MSSHPTPANLFVYGTLLFDEIWESIVMGRYPKKEGTVSGWRRLCVQGCSYPGVIPGNGSVRGIIRFGLNADDWKRLDAFEGEEYEKAPVSVSLPEGENVSAYLYRFRDSFRFRLSDNPWNPERFDPAKIKKAPGGDIFVAAS